jgi:hypothetical protein
MAARYRPIGAASAAVLAILAGGAPIERPGLSVLASATPAQRPAAPDCPARPEASLSPEMPADVCIPDGFNGIALDYFDDYSWRALIALVWPATAGRRGVADAERPISDDGPRVFETYKSMWEVFHRDGSAPQVAFDRYDTAGHNPCGVTSRFGDLTIGSASGIDDIGQAGIGALDPPIVAQNGRYVRTLTLFNELEFDHIVAHRLFLRSELPVVPRPRPDTPVVNFPLGSIAVKTSWVDLTDLPEALAKRFYTRRVMMKRATGGGCAPAVVGLMGLHIAQKTPSRPQWIWSSFEQKDLVPPKWADWPGAFALNDATSAPMPDTNPLSLVPVAPEPVRPFNMTRAASFPILTSTELVNYRYQALLAGTPWRYYRLVMTQWPRVEGNQSDPVSAQLDGSVANTFPGLGAFSATANVTMETFDQAGPHLGCMSCHNSARMRADFMWTVLDHAYPAQFGPATATPGPPRVP